MGIKILQVNIQNWKNNNYLLKCSLADSSPDVILLNDLSLNGNAIPKLRGYAGAFKGTEMHSGVAVFVKQQHKHTFIDFDNNDNILATKLYTNLGPLIVATSYTPPRFNTHPTVAFNRILNKNIPTVFLSDFNSTHPYFENCPNNRPNNLGTQLYTLCNSRNLHYLGPNFQTYRCNNRSGKPDLIIGNTQFRMFQHHITKGKGVGSDHIPIILTIALRPIKVLCPPKLITKKLDRDRFKDFLKDDDLDTLDGKGYAEIDTRMSHIVDRIQEATAHSCPLKRCNVVKTYEYTPEIRHQLRLIQNAYHTYFLYNNPSLQYINTLKRDLVFNLIIHDNKNWKQLVQVATANYGQPGKFWSDINRLRGGDHTKTHHLKVPQGITGYTEGTIIDEPDDMSNLMGACWEKIFHPNQGPEFINNNTRMVNEWYRGIKANLQHKHIIDFATLEETHPIFRPILPQELSLAIKTTGDKTPGMDNIRIAQLLHLPPNYIKAIADLHTSTLSTKYFPQLSKQTKMIFIHKPSKTRTDPYSYRPISLLNTLGKLLEKIIAHRLLYFLEYHNILSDLQFGFRKGRSTQVPIHLLTNAVEHYGKQKHASILSTRDVYKAFDTVWWRGLLYKINTLPGDQLDLASLLYNYLSRREVEPHFQGFSSQKFTPKSGVPQGSSLGPILYLIFVNDIPEPVYRDTIISRFADDIVHFIVSSTPKSKRHSIRNTDIIHRTQTELSRTLKWEQSWKITSNTNKTELMVHGALTRTLTSMGGVSVNNETVTPKENIRILGFQHNRTRTHSLHIRQLVEKANFNLKKLYRFKSAPQKIKLTLYKSLIRPLMEYPSIITANTSDTQLHKLQVIQNKALRFILNTHWTDFTTIQQLHDRARVDMVKDRLLKLQQKALDRTQQLYTNTQARDVTYKFSDYMIEIDPYFEAPKKLSALNTKLKMFS